MPEVWNAWAARFLSLLRIVTALIFIEHALSKIIGFPVAGPPSLPPLLIAAAAIEIVGGILLLIGLFTRPVAFILSGEMAVAYFYFHAPRGMYPLANTGELSILLCFACLYLSAAGGGAWSADNAMRKA